MSKFWKIRRKRGLWKRRWYLPRWTGYTWPDKYNMKWLENFIHLVKGEPQTDMQGRPLPEEATTIVVRL